MPGNQGRSDRRRATTGWLALASLAALVALAGASLGHTSGDHGEISLHDSPDGPPTSRIHCEFWVQGEDMTHETGTIEALQTQDNQERNHHIGSWNVTPNASDDSFEAGPFTLPSAWGNHSFRAVMNGSGDHATPWTETVHYTECDDESQPPACPRNVQAKANEDEEIELSWSPVDDADNYKIYRSGEGAAFSKFASSRNPGFVDETTEAGQSYRYRVMAANEAGESQGCPVVEASAIPTFPEAASFVLATLGGLATLGAIRLATPDT